MDRRTFIKGGAAAGAAAALALRAGRWRADTTVRTRPNIVYLMADDLGYGQLGYEGNEAVSHRAWTRSPPGTCG